MAVSASKHQLRLLAASTALLAVAGLTACSVDATPQKDSPTKTESAPADNTQKETVAPSPENTDKDTDTNTDSDTDDAVAGSRADYAAAVTRTEDCSNGTVAINEPGNVIQIKGACATVAISGDGTVVLADDIGSLKLDGIGSVVFANKIDSVEATGTGNVVSWESGTPTVADTGTGNVLKPVK